MPHALAYQAGLQAHLQDRLVALSVVAGMALAFSLQLRELHRSWGVVPEELGRPLRGDDLVVNPNAIETRSLIVNAPPSAVWPWLVQLGYGRGGWYSYDQLDMKGSRARAASCPSTSRSPRATSCPPTLGVASSLGSSSRSRPSCSISTTNWCSGQMQATAGEQGGDALEGIDEVMPGGLQFAGALGDMTMPVFRVSWAFILDPEEGGGHA